jgi:uncharacterized protein YuzE
VTGGMGMETEIVIDINENRNVLSCQHDRSDLPWLCLDQHKSVITRQEFLDYRKKLLER